MNATQLKYFALIIMVIDHIGAVFDPMTAVVDRGSLLLYLPRFIGRLAFPIFAFLVAEGCRKTEHFPRYLIRLGIFGGASHVLCMVLSGGTWGSVIATFFLAALGIYLAKRLLARALPPATALLPMLLLAVAAELLRTDYGFIGVITVCAVYLCGARKKTALVVLAVCMGVLYLPMAAFPYNLIYTVCACVALIPIACYNGKRGLGHPLFFYWFYPLHIAALFAIRYLQIL